MDEIDLSLVATQSLIDELLGRSDHAVIGMMRITTDKDGQGDFTVTQDWKGNFLTCAGLATALAELILRKNLAGGQSGSGLSE